ncbi:hypothetical protein EJ08DRAFT_56716 [Tothia fuscella]|uniref:Uncharacterized protein n=1 Tax=Tothia fuscella TaxID=1048955 RepID=A0A9P4U204_9PEZI|nr:hypothetical protein EJ08DRAFT_56716 [Tothia fuscella]
MCRAVCVYLAKAKVTTFTTFTSKKEHILRPTAFSYPFVFLIVNLFFYLTEQQVCLPSSLFLSPQSEWRSYNGGLDGGEKGTLIGGKNGRCLSHFLIFFFLWLTKKRFGRG